MMHFSYCIVFSILATVKVDGGGVVAQRGPSLQGEANQQEDLLFLSLQQQLRLLARSDASSYPVCYVCGDSKLRVTKPDNEITFPGQDPVKCSQLEYGGLNGYIKALYCPVLSAFNVKNKCECAPAEDSSGDQQGEAGEQEEAQHRLDTNNGIDPAVSHQKSPGQPPSDEEEEHGNSQDEVTAQPPDSKDEVEKLEQQRSHVAVSTTTTTTTAAAPSPGYPVCHICGSAGMVVTKPDGQIWEPNAKKPLECYKLEYGGLNGYIAPHLCPVPAEYQVPMICGCTEAAHHEEHSSQEASKTAAAGTTMSSANVTKISVDAEATAKQKVEENNEEDAESYDEGNNEMDQQQQQQQQQQKNTMKNSPGYPVCYICGNPKLEVTRPHVKLLFPGQRPIRCSKLEFGGLKGYISPDLCPEMIHERVPETCGCQPIAWHTTAEKQASEGEDGER